MFNDLRSPFLARLATATDVYDTWQLGRADMRLFDDL